jgi:hypothetical protein
MTGSGTIGDPYIIYNAADLAATTAQMKDKPIFMLSGWDFGD